MWLVVVKFGCAEGFAAASSEVGSPFSYFLGGYVVEVEDSLCIFGVFVYCNEDV